MQTKDVEVRRGVMESTVKAKELVQRLGEQVAKAGRHTEAGRPFPHEFGAPLEWPVHTELRERMDGCITEVQRAVTAAWEEPTGFELRQLEVALINLEAGGRMLAYADALASIVGSQDAKRLIELELSR